MTIRIPKDKRDCADSVNPPCKCCVDPRCKCCGEWLESYCTPCMELLEEECALDDERESARSSQAYYFKDGYGNTVEDTDESNVYRYKDIYGNDVTDVYTVSKPERVQYFDH